MRRLARKKVRTVVISFIGMGAFMVSLSMAGKTNKISGKLKLTITKQEIIEVEDAEGHIVSLGKAEGSNTCTGKQTFMDEARVVNVIINDLVMGNGTNRGYIKFIQDEDVTYAQWEGVVTAKALEGQAPIMTHEGTFTFTKGTGRYANIQGGGSFKGQFTSETTSETEWEGEYSIKK